MPASGLFITLYDKDTLNLYLDKGIYGFHQRPIIGKISSRSRHYHALADYACVREDAHVFFFLKRMIVYGGQIIGSKKYGSFYLNGSFSPMGKRANVKLFWDESTRSIYKPTETPGIFRVPAVDENVDKCQPYLIRFQDKLDLKGKWISSDQLYFQLGEYSYPLPSNSIQGMSFCTLTPGETEIALSILKKESMGQFSGKSDEDVSLSGDPLLFEPKYDIQDLNKAMSESWFINEAQLEASINANPSLLPDKMQPNETDVLCRQVPISPYKPYQMDRADVCYYSKDPIADGTIPNTIIELKLNRTGKYAMDQVKRYLDWLHKRLGKRQASRIRVFLCAPSFSITNKDIPSEYTDQIQLISLKNRDLSTF